MLLASTAAMLVMVQASPLAAATAPLDLEGGVQCSTTFLTMSSVTAFSPEFRESQKRNLVRVFEQTVPMGQRVGLTRDALLARMRVVSTERITNYFQLPDDTARTTQRVRWMMDGLNCLRRSSPAATSTIVDAGAPSKAVGFDLESGIRCTAASLTATTMEKDPGAKAANKLEFEAMARKAIPIGQSSGLTRTQVLDRVQANGEARLRQYHFGDAATQARFMTGLTTERADCRRRSSLTP